MASSPSKLHEITRALDLISAPLVLEMLAGLGRGQRPDEIAPAGTDPATIHAALSRLREIGAVAHMDTSTGDRAPTLSAYGHRLLAGLVQIDNDADP